jgi:hypothetical protein
MFARLHATQYALLSSRASIGRLLVASAGGVLPEKFGWVRFFLLATVPTVATAPSLVLLIWIDPQDDLRTNQRERAAKRPDNTSGDPNRRSPSEEPS